MNTHRNIMKKFKKLKNFVLIMLICSMQSVSAVSYTDKGVKYTKFSVRVVGSKAKEVFAQYLKAMRQKMTHNQLQM
jgi:hypothetical protein